MRRFATVAVLALLLAGAPARADDPSLANEAAMGFASGMMTLIYTPLKMVWAIGGAIGGGFAYVFTGGDDDVAVSVLNGALRGDYVLKPEHLRGDEELEFIGRSPRSREAHQGW